MSTETILQVVQDASRLTVRFAGRTIIEHSSVKPVLSLGWGKGRFRSWHGNYKIHEDRPEVIHYDTIEIEEEKTDRITLKCLSSEEDKAVDTPFLQLRVLEAKETGRPVLEISVDNAPEGCNRMWLRLAADGDEHIYGCGEQYTALNLRGRRVPLWVQEQGVGRGRGMITLLANLHSHAGGTWYSTYFPETSFVSSAGWYCLAETSAYSEFDFLSARHHRLYFWDLPVIRIGVEESFSAAAAGLNRNHGLQPELPEWTYNGIWLGVQGGSEEIERKLEEAREAGMKVGALWTQDWEGKRITPFGKQLMWNWKYAEDQYPDLPAQIESLKERGIRFLGYINPFLAIEGDLYEEASEASYCVKNSKGEDYLVTVTSFPAALIDLSNPEAGQWIKGIIKKHMIGIGLDGWMCDYGEYLPTDAVLFSGESGETFHNRYPVEWARVNREAVEEAGAAERVVFFMRSGFNHASRHAQAHWAGDQMVDFSLGDGLATAITAGLSLSFSGVANFHSDVGGFTSLAHIKRSKELLLRWAEYAPFNPIMRSHESNRPHRCFQFNADGRTLAHFARMTKIYSLLRPYHQALAREYQEKAVTPIRHPAMRYPDDTELHRYKYQYLYGDDLFVAPVYLKRRKKRRLYLPDDSWVHLWTGKVYKGGRAYVSAPIGKPPVFYREGSEWTDLFESLQSL